MRGSRILWLAVAVATVTCVGCGGDGVSGGAAVSVIENLPNLGLPEKRELLEINAKVLPETQKLIDETVGKHVPLIIDWASFSDYKDSCTVDRIRRYGLDAIPAALKAVAKDDTGKRALSAKLTTIKFGCRKPSEPSDRAQTLFFKDGVLTIRQGLDGNGVWGEDEMRSELEKNL